MQNNKNSAEQVLARRLRPIYDAIDSGQYKKAVLEADKVLKKHSQISGARALKALALIRTERTNEALNILRTLEKDIADEEFNENTIQAVCHCYKELGSPDRIVTLYTLLAKRYPKNEKLARELFFAHIRTRDFRQQQQIAAQLYKVLQESWAIMSILMQGYENKNLADLMLFPLAEKMLAKLPIDDLCRMQGGIEIRLIVLESRGRFSEAIEFVEVIQRQKLFSDVEKLRLKHKLNSLYHACGRNDILTDRAIKFIKEDMNEWTNWINLIDLIITDCSLGEQEKRVSKHMEIWRGLMNECYARVRHASDLRGPLMARLLFMDRLTKHDILTRVQLFETPLGSPLKALEELFDVCCRPFGFEDMKPFLHLLNIEEKKQLSDHISVFISNVKKHSD